MRCIAAGWAQNTVLGKCRFICLPLKKRFSPDALAFHSFTLYNLYYVRQHLSTKLESYDCFTCHSVGPGGALTLT